MSLKEAFLKLPLKFQINISLICIFIITICLILLFSQAISLIYFQYRRERKNEYFLSMEKSIIESHIYYINMCLLQYENIIKFFNSEIHNYLNNETILKYFYKRNKMPKSMTDQKIHVFHNISELYQFEDYNESIPDEQKKLFIYCDSNISNTCDEVINLINANSVSYLNQNKGLRIFKIPFYGKQPLMREFILYLKKYATLISVNNSRIKEEMTKHGNISNIFNFMNSVIEFDYNYLKKYIDDLSNEKIKLMNLMYEKIYYVLGNYCSINDTIEKEDYLKDQSIYFQVLNYENDMTCFFNNWEKSKTRIIGDNLIIPEYLSWMLFNISKKLDILVVPINNKTKEIISKHMCYYFIIKQIYFISFKSNYSFDENLIDKIYDNIYNNNISDIQECKLGKYLEDLGDDIDTNNEFLNYYDLKNIYNSYFYKLISNNDLSSIFEMKSTYPNAESLKLFYPDYFTFYQLNFHSFVFSANLSRIMAESDDSINNIGYLCTIILWFFWLILTIIFVIIIINVIPKITDPIVRLTQIINLNANDYKNEDIFEYKLDDNINNFFSLCKNLINGEMINNDLKLNEILEDKSLDDSSNHNMIINNKMILELIENQKCLNNNDKNIFVLKEGNYDEKKYKKNIRPKSPKARNRINVNHLDVIKLISLNSAENPEKTSFNSKKENFEKEDIYSQKDEDDFDNRNLKLYEDLIKIADFVFYGKEREKNNKLRKNVDKTSIVSKKSKQENGPKIIKGFNNVTYYWYVAEKANKTISKYSNIIHCHD